MLSIVVPVFNESQTGYLPQILSRYSAIKSCEILCVDGGSEDDTCDLVRQSGQRLIETHIVSRAGRLNVGIEQASFDMVLLHHPRSILDVKGINVLIQQAPNLTWGAFTHKFNLSHPLLRFTSWYSNVVRGDRRGIYYLDHCLFAQKQLLLDCGLVPDMDIFEDTELCLKLKRRAKAQRLPYISQTSAIRFQTQGIYRQALKNQMLKWQFYFKRSDKSMNQDYEQGLELNSRYAEKTKDKDQ